MSLDRLVSGFRPYCLLALLVLAVALPGIAAVPPIDRDESRFAVSSREMLTSGDLVTIHFQDELRAKKPAGAYWVQAGAAWLTGRPNAIWSYRLASVLGAMVAVLMTFRFGAYLAGREAALTGAALLAVTPLLIGEAHQAKTDALLLATVTIAQGALARFYLAARGEPSAPAPGWPTALAFWVAQAAGILIKGPIAPMVSLLTAIALAIADRKQSDTLGWLRATRPVPGLALTVALVAPWAVAVSLATRGQFIAQAAGHDFFAKITGGQEAHAAWPGTYLLAATVTLWPAAAFVLPGLVRAGRERAAPAMRFLLAWIVPTWIAFELVPTKLPHYVLPVFPALALLGGLAVAGKSLAANATSDARFAKPWAKAYAALAGLAGIALAAGALAAPAFLSSGFVWSAIPAALAILLAGLGPAALIWRGRIRSAAAVAVAAAIFAWGFLLGGVAPRLDQLWVSSRIAALVRPGGLGIAAGYHEPSLVFLVGRQVRLNDAPAAAHFIDDTPHAFAAVEASEEQEFERILAELGRSARKLGTVQGFDYSAGKKVTMTVWESEGVW